MEKERKNTRRNKGITLIALVITIIILLILAGVTIGQLTGNGLFENAKIAKEKTLISQYIERINLIKTETMMKDDGNILLNSLNEAFNESNQKYWVNKTEMKDGIIRLTTNDGYTFLITENTIQYIDTNIPEVITAEMLEFIPEDTTWTEITNVKQAIDYLYNN